MADSFTELGEETMKEIITEIWDELQGMATAHPHSAAVRYGAREALYALCGKMNLDPSFHLKD